MIAAFFAPYLVRIVIGVVIAAAIGGGFLYFKIHYESIGYQKAISAIAAKDRSAVDAVKKAIKNVDDCIGIWDTTRGVCTQP